MKVIPAIDLKDGKCVRLYKGDFEQTTEYSNEPLSVARRFASMQSTDLHVVDLDGARSGTQANRDIIAAIAAELDLTIQIGGGIRDRAAVEAWLSAGVSRCVIGSLAITEPDTVRSLLEQCGGERIVLALDVAFDGAGNPLVTTHGWTRPSDSTVFECIENFQGSGLRHVLCTDVSRDGAMVGPNIDLYVEIMARFPGLLLQASGGVRHIQDLEALRARGIPAAITGRALLDGALSATEVISFQQDA